MLPEKSREPVGELPVHATLVLMRVPSGHIGKRCFNAEVRLEQLRNLAHVVAEIGIGVVHSHRRRVLRGICRLQHLHRLKCFIAGRVKNAVARIGIHGLKSARRGRWRRTSTGHGKAVQVADGDCRNFPVERARHFGAERQRAKGRVLLVVTAAVACCEICIFRLQRAVQPAILGALYSRRARFHVVLRVKVRSAHIGRAAGVHDRQVSLIVERLERGERGMQPEESVQIKNLVLRNRNARPHLVVILLAIGNHDVEPVRGAALEDHHQPLVRNPGRLRQNAAHKKIWHRRCAGHGQRAAVQKESTVHLHLPSLQLSAVSLIFRSSRVSLSPDPPKFFRTLFSRCQAGS